MKAESVIELSLDGDQSLRNAAEAIIQLDSITQESWMEAVDSIEMSAIQKKAADIFKSKTKELRDELNRILIIEEPQFDMRTADLGGMPPVAQATKRLDPEPTTLSGWIEVLRKSLHHLVPELDGSDFAIQLSKMLSGIDHFSAIAPEALSKMEVRKDGDGVTNGVDLPGEMQTAGQNVMITPDLSAGGRLVPAQGTGSKKKPTRKIDPDRYDPETLRGLSDREVRSRDSELHRMFDDLLDSDSTSSLKPSIALAHRAVMSEFRRRELAHDRDDSLTEETSKQRTTKLLGVEVAILKADSSQDERYVLGIVLEPNNGKDGAPLDPDAQKDIYDALEIQATAHAFMSDFQQIGLMHERLISKGVRILESYIAPVDFEIEGRYGRQQVRKGSWLLALRILSDAVWSDIKDGTLTGFSIGGDARRIPAGKS